MPPSIAVAVPQPGPLPTAKASDDAQLETLPPRESEPATLVQKGRDGLLSPHHQSNSVIVSLDAISFGLFVQLCISHKYPLAPPSPPAPLSPPASLAPRHLIPSVPQHANKILGETTLPRLSLTWHDLRGERRSCERRREQALPDEESAGVTESSSGNASRPSDTSSSHLSRNCSTLPSDHSRAHPLRPYQPSPPLVIPVLAPSSNPCDRHACSRLLRLCLRLKVVVRGSPPDACRRPLR